MARPKKQYSSRERQKRHEAALERRRKRHAEKRTVEMASQAAEGESDFVGLVEAEQVRIDKRKALAVKGGSQSPKVTVQARDDLALAFDLMGGVAALVVWGRHNPTEFYRIWARLIPKEALDTGASMPLEQLLEKLATKEEKTVGQAAYEIGEELLARGRIEAEAEDALFNPKGNA